MWTGLIVVGTILVLLAVGAVLVADSWSRQRDSMILQRYEFRLRDGNGNEHDVLATGNTVKAALYVAGLHAGQRWTTPIDLVSVKPASQE